MSCKPTQSGVRGAGQRASSSSSTTAARCTISLFQPIRSRPIRPGRRLSGPRFYLTRCFSIRGHPGDRRPAVRAACLQPWTLIPLIPSGSSLTTLPPIAGSAGRWSEPDDARRPGLRTGRDWRRRRGPATSRRRKRSRSSSVVWRQPAVGRSARARLPQLQPQPTRGAPEARRGTRVQANVAGCWRYWSSAA